MKKESKILTLIIAGYAIGGSLVAGLVAWIVQTGTEIASNSPYLHISVSNFLGYVIVASMFFFIPSLLAGIYVARCVVHGRPFSTTKYYKTYLSIWLAFLLFVATYITSLSSSCFRDLALAS